MFIVNTKLTICHNCHFKAGLFFYRFAEFMETETFLQGSRTPDCQFSLHEGTAGTICFLADLLKAGEASFPLFDVFEM